MAKNYNNTNNTNKNSSYNSSYANEQQNSKNAERAKNTTKNKNMNKTSDCHTKDYSDYNKDLLAFQTKKAGRFLAIKNKKKDMKM